MKVFNLHGYNGSPQNAAYLALSELGCEVVSPSVDYDSAAPDTLLARFMLEVETEHPDIIAGTSLGGFFASVLSAKCHKPLITVNPCLMPFLTLPELGFEGDIKGFIKMFGLLAEIDMDNVCAIVGGQDEVIGSHDFTRTLFGNERFHIALEGKHSGFTLPLKEYFEKCLAYYKAANKI